MVVTMLLIHSYLKLSAYRAGTPAPVVSTDVLESGDLLPPNNVTVEARARARCRKNPSLVAMWLWLKFIKNTCLPAAKHKLYVVYILIK